MSQNSLQYPSLKQPVRSKSLSFDQLFPFFKYIILQRKAPYTRVDRYGWIVTGYDEASESLTNQSFQLVKAFDTVALSLLKDRRNLVFLHVLRLIMNYKQFFDINENWSLFLNPNEHSLVKRQMRKGMGQGTERVIKGTIKRRVAKIEDTYPKHQPFDFVKQYSSIVPYIVMIELLGIPSRLKSKVFSSLLKIRNVYGIADRQIHTIIEALRVQKQLLESLEHILLEGLYDKNGLIDRYIDVLNKEPHLFQKSRLRVLSSNLLFLLVAGVDTLPSYLSNSLLHILMNPTQFDDINSNYQIIPLALEESLRLDPPVSLTHRYRDQEVLTGNGNHDISGYIDISIFAANRDPSVFTDPHKFDIYRENNKKHISFGKGRHHCAGYFMARLEAQITVEEMLRTFPNIKLARNYAPTRKVSSTFSSLKSLDLILDP